MTEAEIAILNKLGGAWNLFQRLPDHHPSDLEDFTFHVHALQNMILARETVRNNPTLCTQPIRTRWDTGAGHQVVAPPRTEPDTSTRARGSDHD